ncbi:MAG: site-2 protease family protein [Verrucomicrobiales bacterium]|nr:site-2 protease family protein [Verrucomicrobiales bacterium]
MKWSLKIGRYAGIDVYLHVTFLLFLGFIGAAQTLSGAAFGAVVEAVLFFVAVFGCVLLHEFGHALAARQFGIRTRDITLLPIGGVARLERMPDRPLQELWVALAGPAVNVGIATLLVIGLAVSGTLRGGLDLDMTEGSFAVRLLTVNVVLVIFNMIPAFPMDGGRVLRALLAIRLDYAKATQIAATLGQGFALVFAFFGLIGLLGGGGNPLLLFIALFVWIGASQETGMAQFRSALGGATVRDAMLTNFLSLAPHEPLARAVELVMAGSQQDFPVVNGRQVVGILTRKRLLAALAEGGKAIPIGSIMDSNVGSVTAQESLEATLAAYQGKPFALLPVLDRGELVGLLTWENVSEYVWIRSALGVHRGRPGLVAQPPILRS